MRDHRQLAAIFLFLAWTLALCQGDQLPAGIPLIPDGLPCSVEYVAEGHASCGSGFCNYNFVCGSLPDSSWCHRDEDCASGICSGFDSGLLCTGLCGVFPDGAVCAEDSECNGGSCRRLQGSPYSFCAADPATSSLAAAGARVLEVCREGDLCPEGLVCNSFGACMALLQDGAPCNLGTDCESQVCNGLGVCGIYEGLGHMCVEDDDCRSGYCSFGSEFAPGICAEPASLVSQNKKVAFLNKVWMWLWSYE